jgi:hypothetical protein
MTANLRGGYFAPTVASITPNSGSNNGTVTVTALLGNGFVYGVVFLLRHPSFGEVAATTVEWIGKAKLAGTLNLFAVPSGIYSVVVRNPDGQEAVLAGAFTVNSASTGIGIPELLVNALYQNNPNPFNPVTTIRYSIKEKGRVTLTVFNTAGQRVRTIVDDVQSPTEGGYSVLWDGTNDAGGRVASGVYLYKLTAPGGYESVRKLVLLK